MVGVAAHGEERFARRKSIMKPTHAKVDAKQDISADPYAIAEYERNDGKDAGETDYFFYRRLMHIRG